MVANVAPALPYELTDGEIEAELVMCAASYLYFIITYCKIYDAQASDWIPFELWPEQIQVADIVHENQFTIALKARQLGISWLALAYILWLMLFRPATTALIFSKRDDEAMYLLNEERLKGIYNNLPGWLKVAAVSVDNAHQFGLDNGSIARAFPAWGGDSYTASVVLIDEADIIPDLPRLMRSVKPTIDAGGKLIMVSRVDKEKPASTFKKIYREAKSGRSGWAHIFLPWWVRPERTQAWYEDTRQEIMGRTGSDDELKEQYPASDTEALEPPKLNKRIPGDWLTACYVERNPIPTPPDAPAIGDLVVYEAPQPGVEYVAGADCAEGLPTSDDSATWWIRKDTGAQVAKLQGKITADDQAAQSLEISKWYNDAPILIERNNHGHSMISWFTTRGYNAYVINGRDNRPGWNDDALGKSMLYGELAEATKNQRTVIRDLDTYAQVASIEKSSLRAPKGEMDDLADAHALAVLAIRLAPVKPKPVPVKMEMRGLYRSQRPNKRPDPRFG